LYALARWPLESLRAYAAGGDRTGRPERWSAV